MHRLTVEWPDHSFTTSEEAAHIATRALSDASKALGINEPRIVAHNRAGGEDEIPESAFVDSTDAMLWARAFVQRVNAGCDPTDAGWLVGWFANAMAAQQRALAAEVRS